LSCFSPKNVDWKQEIVGKLARREEASGRGEMKHWKRKEVGKKQPKEANVVDVNAGSTNFIVLLPKTRRLEGGSVGSPKEWRKCWKAKKNEKKEVSGKGRVCQGMEKQPQEDTDISVGGSSRN